MELDEQKIRPLFEKNKESTMSDRLLPIYNKPHIEFVKWADPYEKKPKVDIQHEEEGWHEEQEFPPRAFFTPFGHMSLDHSISEQFCLYIGHTNFPVSHKVVNAIENTAGVETFDIFSPYRFRVAVGKLFLARDVFREIKRNVFSTLKKNKIKLKDG